MLSRDLTNLCPGIPHFMGTVCVYLQGLSITPWLVTEDVEVEHPHTLITSTVWIKNHIWQVGRFCFKYTVAVCIFQEYLLHTLHVIWTDLIMKYMLTFQSSLLLSLCIRISISVHAGTEFLGMCWQSWISGASQKCHPHSCCFIFVNKKKSQGANLGEYGEYGTTNVFLSAEICCIDGAVCVSALLMVNQPFLIVLSFRAFSMDLFAHTLQNFPVTMQFNHLAWRNKFLMNSAPAVKKWSPTCCNVWYDVPCFVHIWKQLLFGLWAATGYPGFVTCFGCWEEALIISDFKSFLNTKANVPAYQWATLAETSQRYTAHSCPLFEFNGMLHTRNLSCQQSPKSYFTSLHQWFFFSPWFCLWNQCRDDLNTDSLQLKFPHILIQKATQKCVFLPSHCHQKLSWAFHVLLLQFVGIWR